MKILHLEDFKNEVEVLKDFKFPSIISANPGINYLAASLSNRDVMSVGGRQLYFVLHGNRHPSVSNFRSFKIDVTSGGNKLLLEAIDNSNSSHGTASPPSCVDAGIVIVITRTEGIRKIISFSFTYRGPTTGSSTILADNSNPVTAGPLIRKYYPSGVKIQVEIVHDGRGMRIYLDHLLSYSGASRTTNFPIVIGKNPESASPAISPTTPFSMEMENLVIVEVPEESKIRRLTNVKVVSTIVNKINDVVQTSSDPVNDGKILTSPGVNLVGDNTLEFSKPVLGALERVLGTQTVMAVKSNSAETVNTKLLNNTEELHSNEVPVDSVLQSRVVIGDTNSSNSDNISAQITVVDLEE